MFSLNSGVNADWIYNPAMTKKAIGGPRITNIQLTTTWPFALLRQNLVDDLFALRQITLDGTTKKILKTTRPTNNVASDGVPNV